MEYKHNDITRNYYNSNTINYIVKVNSRDRHILSEPNPFDFKIKFNKIQGKYTFNMLDSTGFNNITTHTVHAGAVIEDAIEEVKDLHISDIVAPRFIPDNFVGIQIYKINVITNPNNTKSVFLKTTDNTKVTYIEENVVVSGNTTTFKFFKIEDTYKNKYYLFNSTVMNNLVISNSDPYITIKKNYYLTNDFYTDTLLLNGTIYKISNIMDGYIILSINGIDTDTNFISSSLILPTYYTDIIWNTPSNPITFDNNIITINENAESMIAYDLVKDSIIEIYDIDNDKYYYIKIDAVEYTLDLNNDIIFKRYPDITLTDSEYNLLKNFISDPSNNIKNKLVIRGKSIYGTINLTTSNVRLTHLKPGVKDLLNEKLFYLSLDPITPIKNLITNNKLNNVIGTFYPSTQTKNYIFLNGQNRQNFAHRNLKNFNELKFKLYYIDGTLVGENLKNYSLSYLSMECKQTNLTLLVDCVDRTFS